MITVQESMHYIHGICATKELSDCQTEALDIAIKAVQKQIPKEPVNFHRDYDEHEWRKNADGEPDEWAWMFDIHNGPVCERCGFSFCEGCNPHGWTAKKCYIDYYSCPECRNQIDKGDKFCKKCGQALQWDKFKKTVKRAEHDRGRY